MNRRLRVVILAVSVPIVVFAAVGGFMSRAMAARGESSYQHLRIFEDVVSLISSNYVEAVDLDTVMRGAMHGLADGLDPDTAYLDKAQVAQFEAPAGAATGETGLELTRQYYLRVIAAREGSPAARAGLMPGDYIRAIDGQSTRDTTVFEGSRRLRGAPGTTVRLTVLRGNAADPHEVDLTREVLPEVAVSGRMAAPGTGYLRVVGFGPATAGQLAGEAARLQKAGATRLLIDLRSTATGTAETGLAAARVFVPEGTLGYEQERGKDKVAAGPARAAATVTLPVLVLTDNGTSGAAEVFAAALQGNRKAEVVGERTRGRAARQKLVKLPDGSGLLLTHLYYLAPGGSAIHEKGIVPDVAVEQPTPDFGQAPPAGDPILEKALAHVADRPAA